VWKGEYLYKIGGRGTKRLKQGVRLVSCVVANQGDNIAKYSAANLINDPEVDEKDGEFALKLLEEARISGEIERGFAENSISWYYLMGLGGVEKDYKKSLYWGIQGGKKGATNAYSNVALQYFAGLGVTQNYDMMVGYLIKSLENFEDEDDWILADEDEWVAYKKDAPEYFWDAREIYWKFVLHKDEKYLLQLRSLVE
jgi:FOG: TPR repeat, SEL1 subfamily